MIKTDCVCDTRPLQQQIKNFKKSSRVRSLFKKPTAFLKTSGKGKVQSGLLCLMYVFASSFDSHFIRHVPCSNLGIIFLVSGIFSLLFSCYKNVLCHDTAKMLHYLASKKSQLCHIMPISIFLWICVVIENFTHKSTMASNF